MSSSSSGSDNTQYDTLARMTSFHDDIRGVMYKDGDVQLDIPAFLAASAPVIRIGRNRFYVETDMGRGGHFSMTKGRVCIDGFLDVFGYRKNFLAFSSSMFVAYATEADWLIVTGTTPSNTVGNRDRLIDSCRDEINNDSSMLVALKDKVIAFLEAMRKQRPNELTWSDF